MKGKKPQKPGYEVKARNLRGERVLKLVCTPRVPPKLWGHHGGQGRAGNTGNLGQSQIEDAEQAVTQAGVMKTTTLA